MVVGNGIIRHFVSLMFDDPLTTALWKDVVHHSVSMFCAITWRGNIIRSYTAADNRNIFLREGVRFCGLFVPYI
jgi:hypothetical protein